jgi:hypothetical protein
MTKKVVYLCGGINKLTDAECKDWREEAKRLLGDDFVILDPMRRDYRGIEGDHTNDIVLGDIQDIVQSSVILVRAEVPSWGTAMEIVYAWVLGKAIIAFGAGSRPSPWLMYHTKGRLTPTLQEAVAWIKTCI